jgi:thiol-disulfide isomerase/thioredoxin
MELNPVNGTNHRRTNGLGAIGRFVRRGACVVLAALVPILKGICAEQSVEIQGVVESANYNPKTGEALPYSKAHSAFLAKLSGAAWWVCVTNSERGITWWSQRIYDGTNTYVLKPSGGSFWQTNPPNPRLQLATISPSTSAVTLDADPFGAALVSMTYGLSARSFATNLLGLIEMPLPWTVVRDNPNAFGFNWVIRPSAGGRFLQEVAVLREKSLDLPEREELLRPELDYPETLPIYQGLMSELRDRIASPQGYRRAQYKCNEWNSKNDLTLPKASTLEVFLPSGNGDFPTRIFRLESTNVVVRLGTEPLLPEIAIETSVADYRYKRITEKRIFKYGDYTLRPGDSWLSSEDPRILRKAEDWMQHGQEYTHFAESAHLSEEQAQEREATNKPAAHWETTDIDGKMHSLIEYRGKVVILDFWFRGCEPCIKAMPQIKEIAEKYQGRPVAVLGMNTDKKQEDARFVVNQLKLNYPTLKAEGLPEKYNVQGFPTLVIIDQQGMIRGWHLGYSPDLGKEVCKVIERLLAGHD